MQNPISSGAERAKSAGKSVPPGVETLPVIKVQRALVERQGVSHNAGIT